MRQVPTSKETVFCILYPFDDNIFGHFTTTPILFRTFADQQSSAVSRPLLLEEIGCEQPVYGAYDAAFDEALKPYIDALVSARGPIDCPQAFRLIGKLQRECADFARLSQNETYWNLSHRACVIAWLKACVLYVANGCKWEKSIEGFVRWSLNYDLWCKMQFFGEDIERANNGEGSRIGSRGPRNLLELLPDEFTLEDAKRVRRQQGLSNEDNRCQKMIRTWVNRHYVIQNTEYSFFKERYTSV